MVAAINNRPLVSCIIPTKNRKDLVTRAVRSVLDQSYNNIEIIVIDDSTNDTTQKALVPFGGQIRYIKNEKSRGAPYSRNIGLNEAQGDVIAFLDDDDIWLPEKTVIQLKWLEKYPLVTCNYTTELKGRRYYVKYPEIVSYENLLSFNGLGSCSFVMIDGKAAKDCLFDENAKAGQDWDFWLTVMKTHSIEDAVNSNKYLVNYNSGDFSRISNTHDILTTFYALYQKRSSEYTLNATRCLFFNALRGDESLMLWILLEWAKIKMKGKGGIFFLSKLVFKKFFRRIEMF